MQDSREIDYFGQRILQIVQPLATTTDRREVLSLLAKSIANNFAADGCWILQYPAPGVSRVAASGCVSHRTNSVTSQLTNYEIPNAPKPIQWKMPLLPDYHVMVVDTRESDRVTGCVVVATKGVKWYREIELVLQMVSEYVAVAVIEEDLQVQARISQIYPQLHYRLAQAIVENRSIEQLFETAVADMLELLQLKRGLVLTLKSHDLPKQPQARISHATADPVGVESSVESNVEYVDEWDRPLEEQEPSERVPAVAVEQVPVVVETPTALPKSSTQIQIVTTVDLRKVDLAPLPASFLLESSHMCQAALAKVPEAKIFEGKELAASPLDRLIFQDDRLQSTVMIPLIGATTAERPPSEAIWGWLVLQHDRSRHWHPTELKLLQCQIYQIALARIHRKSLRQARSTVDNRTSQVQTSLQLQAKLHDVGRKRMEKLRKANELKDEFISTIGHELRTPLTSMSLAIKMLRQANVDAERRDRYLDILEDQCQREIKLVNDLLKFQQLESRQLEFKPQRIALDRFIAEQADLVSDRWAANKSLDLSLQLPQIPLQIETDTDSLQHILEELLINAGKFALPQTQVEVGLTIEPDRAIVWVANLSKPISSEDLSHLFDRFRRGPGATQQAIAGTGLGLALVKSMVEHIQGTIVATNEPISPEIAKTCFTVNIPLELELN